MKHSAYQASADSQIIHELHISLTGILGITYLLKKTSLDSTQQAYLEMLQEAANRLRLLEKKLNFF